MSGPPLDLHAAARAAHAAGLCVLPPKEDGSKQPDAVSWTRYQETRSTPDEIAAWYAAGRRTGLGLVCGAVSGHLELFEFDDLETHARFLAAAADAGLGPLVARVAAGYAEQTPGEGIHWLYLVQGGGAKTAALARRPGLDAAGKPHAFPLIETKGEGGYVVVAPSHGTVHPSGKPYRLLSGGFATITTLTAAERDALWSLARTFDEVPPAPPVAPASKPDGRWLLRPGDDFTERAEWAEILEPHGWEPVRAQGAATLWRRPGGYPGGWGASTNHGGRDLLHVFTTAAPPLTPDRSCTKFTAYALLAHGGDFAAAATALEARGYGRRRIGAEGVRGSDPDGTVAEPLPWTPPLPLPEGARPPFLADRLPSVLNRYVVALAQATQTPSALAALLVLAVLAAAAATRVVVRVRDGWKEPVNLFIAVALGPANRKSAVFAECAAPLEAFERAETLRQAPDLAEQASALKIKKKQLEALERQAASVDERHSEEEQAAAKEWAVALARELAAMPVPELPRLVVDDCSPERLASLLASQAGRIAVLSPEGGVFGMMAGRYSKSSQPNLDVYLKGHAGDPLRVDRVGRPPDHVPHPALTIGLAVQPGVIRQLAERPEFRERGLPARFLYGMPRSWVGSRRIGAPPVPEELTDAYARLVRAVLELPRYVDQDGTPLPKPLRLAQEADATLHAFEERLEPRLGEHGDLGHIADWAGKLAGATCRIAGLLHLSQHAAGKAPWDIPIVEETMTAAIGLAEAFFIPHALTAFAAMGADPNLEAARRLLGWIAKHRCADFSIRDAHQDLRRHDLSTTQIERAALLLTEHGYLRAIVAGEPGASGRPGSPRFAVNPGWLAHNPHNPQNPLPDLESGHFEDCVGSEDASPAKQERDRFEESEDGATPFAEDLGSGEGWREVVF